MKKGFKKHMMYAKDGKGVMANTMQDHLDLKKKGYGHSKPKANKGMKYQSGGHLTQLN
tara:strand:+ start:285 stop:458 length:174 start_codon:yes stop_codon:yes gene_type:complete